MTTQIHATSAQKPSYEPTPDQLAREKALQRFNRLYVYTPMLLVGIATLALLIFMLWHIFTVKPENQEGFYALLSGLADLILIFFNIIPMMLFCAVGPALFAYLVVRTNKRRKLPEHERRGKLQVILWRIDQVIAKIQLGLRDTYLEKAARPIIQGQALAAAIQALAQYIQRIFARPKE